MPADSSQLPGGEPSRRGTANVGLSSFANLYGRQLLQPEAEHIFTHGIVCLLKLSNRTFTTLLHLFL